MSCFYAARCEPNSFRRTSLLSRYSNFNSSLIFRFLYKMPAISSRPSIISSIISRFWTSLRTLMSPAWSAYLSMIRSYSKWLRNALIDSFTWSSDFGNTRSLTTSWTYGSGFPPFAPFLSSFFGPFLSAACLASSSLYFFVILGAFTIACSSGVKSAFKVSMYF